MVESITSKIVFKKSSKQAPTIHGANLRASVYPNDDFEVAVWSNVHGEVQVEIWNPSTGERCVITASC